MGKENTKFITGPQPTCSICLIICLVSYWLYLRYLRLHSGLICPSFFIWVFFHKHSRFIGQQGKGEAISLTPLYHFHQLNKYLDISQAITAEISPLYIASCRTRTRKFWFPSASR